MIKNIADKNKFISHFGRLSKHLLNGGDLVEVIKIDEFTKRSLISINACNFNLVNDAVIDIMITDNPSNPTDIDYIEKSIVLKPTATFVREYSRLDPGESLMVRCISGSLSIRVEGDLYRESYKTTRTGSLG